MVKAVYWWDSSDIFPCQKPDFKSILENSWVPTMDSVVWRKDNKGGSSVEACSFIQRITMGYQFSGLTAKCLLARLRSLI